jgi:hypothetical protein
LGVRAPSSFRGRSLWSGLQQGVAWSDPAIVECTYNCRNPFRAEGRNAPRLLGVRDGRFKLVIRIEPGGTEEVYDLETDAAEMHPKIDEIDDETRKRRGCAIFALSWFEPDCPVRQLLWEIRLEWKSNNPDYKN